ncbi:hypothetical protein [Polynucleobacter necessarius]|uniref:hypothetical protein n=1 Tax=Polynucleobacter necessarius TaxID=576610 RepID=UPI0013B04DC0|nr:hypothetical protein [Polynucleobacter necessarius]
MLTFFKNAFGSNETLGKTSLIGFVGYVAVMVATSILADRMLSGKVEMSNVDPLSSAVLFLLVLPYEFWLAVSLWRCAGNTSHKLATIFAKAIAILVAALFVISLFGGVSSLFGK